VVVNLQQDKDIAYWGIDFEANKRKCQELGIQLIRKPVCAAAAAFTSTNAPSFASLCQLPLHIVLLGQ